MSGIENLKYDDLKSSFGANTIDWSFRAVVQLLCSSYIELPTNFFFRNKEIRRMKESMKSGNNFSFLCHDINELEHSNQVNLPRVSVVMPLKGFGEHNLHNWRSQVKYTSLF